MNNAPQPSHLTWGGYTLEQIAYERALTLARLEVEKDRLAQRSDRMRAGNFSMSPSIFSRLLSALNYVDYAVIATQLYRKLSPLFKKKDSAKS